MKFLQGLATWCGPVLVAFGLLLWAWHSTLLQLLLPFRFLAAECALTGGAISFIAWFLLRAASASRVKQAALLLFAVSGLVLGAWQYRAQSLAYTQSIVSFQDRGVTLVGTLYLPNKEGPFPGIVVVHGAGSFRRRFYHVIADHFVRSGFAVLIYDKRGIGDSSGHYEYENNVSPENIELLASDASAALTTLAARREVRADLVGFWGVSQAGWIVPRAGVLNGHAGFMLISSGPTTTTGEQLEYARVTGGHDPGTGMTPQRAEELMARVPAQGYDPVPDLRVLKIPGLWLEADRDWKVPVNKTIRILDDLIRRDGKPFQYRIFHGAGHSIFLPPIWGKIPNLEFAPGFWETMDAWLVTVTAAKPTPLESAVRLPGKTRFRCGHQTE